MNAAQSPGRIDRGGWSWALFEGGRNPYVILCMIYVLAPYISTVVIGDPVRGQQIISGWHAIAGYILAITAPVLGAMADKMGRRKPLLFCVLAIMAPAIFIQYWALPGGAGLPLWAIGGAIIVAGVTFTWTEVLHNSLLTTVAKPSLVPHVSGLSLALGNAISVVLLVFVLWGLALPGQVDWPFLPERPLFGLDPAAFEPSRIVAPISAACLLLFAIPLFLYAPDVNSTGQRFGDALRGGLAGVARTLRKVGEYRNVVIFLLARMLYADGKTAILIFSGVYAAGVMQWQLIEMLTFGVLLSVFAVCGGVAGGWLDHLRGPKLAVSIEIGVTLLCLIAMVSMAPGQMFFAPIDADARVWNGPMFQTAPELAYLGFAMVIAVSITAAYASSRTLMARLCPPGMEGEVFGLYGLSGAATAWLGPLLVERFTTIFQSQRAGFASIAILLLAGFALLLFVKPPQRA